MDWFTSLQTAFSQVNSETGAVDSATLARWGEVFNRSEWSSLGAPAAFVEIDYSPVISREWMAWVQTRIAEGWQFEEAWDSRFVYYRARDPSGFQRGVVLATETGSDRAFTIAALAAAALVTWGVASAAAGAGASGAGATSGAASGASGAAGAAGAAGEGILGTGITAQQAATAAGAVSQVDDYTSFLDAGTLGESVPVTSDASTVNYGFEADIPDGLPPSPAPVSVPEYTELQIPTATVPEPSTGFGAVSYPFGDGLPPVQEGNPVAVAPGVADRVRQGGTLLTTATRTVRDVAAGFGSIWAGPAGSSRGSQVEPARGLTPRAGQLQTSSLTGGIGGVSFGTIGLVALGIGAALLIFRGAKG